MHTERLPCKLLQAEYGDQYKLFFMCSPYCRTRQTFVAIRQAFEDRHFAGLQEEVQLREQDFGNMQQPEKIKQDIAERNRFGRFYFRFPNGESSSDVSGDVAGGSMLPRYMWCRAGLVAG